MKRWIDHVLPRIRELAGAGCVRLTNKAERELRALDLGLDRDDCCDVLKHLTVSDSAGRLQSSSSREWMYVFKPYVMETRLYLKLILRADCVVVSFHEEGEEHDEESPTDV